MAIPHCVFCGKTFGTFTVISPPQLAAFNPQYVCFKCMPDWMKDRFIPGWRESEAELEERPKPKRPRKPKQKRKKKK